mgnify:CR=1 FL=1
MLKEGEISILYEDEEILAINKPSGVLVHASRAESELSPPQAGMTVADWVLARYPEMAHVGEPMVAQNGAPISRPGIVHRLDKDTSGILLLAKTHDAFCFLKKLFQDREIHKEYKAIVYGVVKEDTGTIDLPIARSAGDFRKKSTHSSAVGTKRLATTKFRTDARAEDMSFLTVFPKTGRTHQIRVHLKAIGHSVVCDRLYAPKFVCPPELSRLALHAFAIEFSIPRKGIVERLRLEAPLAEDIARFAKKKFPELRFEA